MELRPSCVYLYEFSDYAKLSMDIELLMEINSESQFTLFSRLPTRRLIERLDLSKIDHYWITENEGKQSIKPDIENIFNLIMKNNNDGLNVYLVDGLEYILSSSNNDDLLSKMSQFTDDLKPLNSALIYCIDSLAFDNKWIIKLRHLSQILQIKTPEVVDVSITEVEDEEEAVEVIQHELGIDGGPRLAYLARLPEIGFTNEILVKRILQWRRMGLDVSKIEPAMSYSSKEAYELYKLVEEDVRRATELERFIHANQEHLNTSEIATDLFRIRQLTGLDELEQKYYTSS
ncbi:MAG TPA: DUF835 domain-containing protein [Candidatus Poseidoniales archaeon]|nr:MAG TPA: DUF835 domain-containing protein [Candidatus Poseidoniales archaeon]HII49694.1 DUF835 domain-containing protein [Candidatus Poseidoniaceae archaeon]|tara:strand:+ start:7320 stop:8186 length:867 start_codon:yes stop_codon:yes gene_type:complete